MSGSGNQQGKIMNQELAGVCIPDIPVAKPEKIRRTDNKLRIRGDLIQFTS
jgi:hypothetical protein